MPRWLRKSWQWLVGLFLGLIALFRLLAPRKSTTPALEPPPPLLTQEQADALQDAHEEHLENLAAIADASQEPDPSERGRRLIEERKRIRERIDATRERRKAAAAALKERRR